jgi:hypothetical protein
MKEPQSTVVTYNAEWDDDDVVVGLWRVSGSDQNDQSIAISLGCGVYADGVIMIGAVATEMNPDGPRSCGSPGCSVSQAEEFVRDLQEAISVAKEVAGC